MWWRHYIFGLFVCPSVRASVRTTRYFVNRLGNFTKFTTLVQQVTKVNSLCFEIKSSNVKITIRPNNVVKMRKHRYRSLAVEVLSASPVYCLKSSSSVTRFFACQLSERLLVVAELKHCSESSVLCPGRIFHLHPALPTPEACLSRFVCRAALTKLNQLTR